MSCTCTHEEVWCTLVGKSETTRSALRSDKGVHNMLCMNLNRSEHFIYFVCNSVCVLNTHVSSSTLAVF